MRMTKRDARFLSPEAQAEIRLRVINAVRAGMKQAQAARTFGVSRWSVVQWTKLHRSNGAQALAPKRRGRRAGEAGKLSIKQAQRIRALVGKVRPRHRDALKAATRKWLHRRQKQPAILANFFNEPHVSYAAA